MTISGSKYVIEHLLGADLVRSQGSETPPLVPRRGDIVRFDSADGAVNFRVLQVIIEYKTKQTRIEVQMDIE